VAPNLGVLLAGWSVLEGIGAALIMPAIVALVAANFPADRRAAAYGLIAASGAIAVAVGPLLGGAVTTFASWRWVFVGEAVIVVLILVALRKIQDTPPVGRARFDGVGALLSIVGLSLLVYGVLRAGTWGFVKPKPGGPVLLGTSPVVWLVLGGLLVIYGFFLWEGRVGNRGGEPLVRPAMLRNAQLDGGLTLFFFQFFIQAGVFFTVPLFLLVVLELSPLQTGVRLLPLSVALLVTAIGIPRLAPKARPRLVVRLGLASMTAGTLVFVGGLNPSADAGIVTIPMLLLGLGIGALAGWQAQPGRTAVAARRAARQPFCTILKRLARGSLPPVLAEGEAVGLGPWTGEGDLEGAVGDGAALADELVHPLLRDRAVAITVDVASVCLAGWLSVDGDAASHRGLRRCRSHDEVEVAGVEAAGYAPLRLVQRGRLLGHGRLARQGPLVEPQPRRDRVAVRSAGHSATGRCEVLRALVAGVVLR
jgi:MFS family permease